MCSGPSGGYSINANGFNNVTQRTLNYFSNNFHIVRLKETRFTGLKSFKRSKFLWKKTSQLNSSFWSQDNMRTSYTGHSGVGLLLTPSVPLHNPRDVTKEYFSTSDILERYLIVHGKIDSVDTYIHVVYAPAQPSQRKHFFSSLPRYFDDDSLHIVVIDFNTVLSRYLDLHGYLPRLSKIFLVTIANGPCGGDNIGLSFRLGSTTFRPTQTRADLKTKFDKQAQYSSKQQFVSDLEASERCSKFFFRPPQVLHKTPILVDSSEELELLCSQ
ncbi:hypothetical protein PsorP6_016962 [Peronosclerospora sorghi]|uniref:Uncharacterized protein n=1 Tax=Peronosclerospora sorghi TaxID=230839 RepID=A0ACC0WE96_9STRA|nr:hypothetical protein PsorP6_016962 [Peronosclerospora sorghi]